MKRFVFAQLALLAVLMGAFLAPAPASAAYDPFGGVHCEQNAQIRTSTVCQTDGGNPVTGPTGILIRATRIVAIIAGIGAVIIIAVAGINYITSGGDANKVAQAKRTIIFAAVGLVLIAVAQAVIAFVIGRI
ncbi:MAG TPA: hypothetical protein VK983_03675 [Candidatus Limnocylindrales bacterium]|nr:hypothetical protein [Candidatus Limnocylindrales bacterium]